ncbi:MAG: hypothetical protein F9K48_08460 [Candidatus Brocadia sp.]|nr:MAG: hypothetical protein F9K48_08460 [Candidatus Brocadia sp.]
MVKQTASLEIGEVKQYKELQSQLVTEQKKLSDTESKLAQIRKDIQELEGKASKSEVYKKDAIERFVRNEITQAELEGFRKKSVAAAKEYDDTMELIAFSEEVIAKQGNVIAEIQRKMRDVSLSIWDKIAEKYQDKFEKAIGDTAGLLWVAMRSGGRYTPLLSRFDLPERFRAIAAPDSKECETLKARLWNEFVGAD